MIKRANENVWFISQVEMYMQKFGKANIGQNSAIPLDTDVEENQEQDQIYYISFYTVAI